MNQNDLDEEMAERGVAAIERVSRRACPRDELLHTEFSKRNLIDEFFEGALKILVDLGDARATQELAGFLHYKMIVR